MKTLIAFLLITASLQSFAASFANSTFMVGGTSYSTTYPDVLAGKEAREILNDVGQLEATGRLTENLNKRIADFRTIEPKLSAEEALDIIIEAANKTISQIENK